MPRIIAGTLGGRTIPAPPGSGTRPTSERVREAMFSRLTGWDAIADVRVLDLFAGTGAFALEALSRGAASAILVEAHAPTAQRIRRTVRDLGLAPRAEVRQQRAEAALEAILEQARRDGRIGLVLLDPPYDLPNADLVSILERLRPALTRDAVIVIERSARTEPVAWPAGYAEDDARRYGETRLQFGGPMSREPTDGALGEAHDG